MHSSQLRLAPGALVTHVCSSTRRDDGKPTYLKEAIQFCREHHIPFCLERSGHERFLPRQLSVRDVDKSVVGEDDRDVRLEAERLCVPLLHQAQLLQVDGPPRLLPVRILDPELEDAVVLRDDVR